MNDPLYRPIVDELPAGYRWANEDETERWQEIAGLILVRRGPDDECDLAVPGDEPQEWYVVLEVVQTVTAGTAEAAQQIAMNAVENNGELWWPSVNDVVRVEKFN
jgi:hypothetical protein